MDRTSDGERRHGDGSVYERSGAGSPGTRDFSKFEDTNILKINNSEMLEITAKG